MFRDYEDQLKDGMEELLESYTLETLLELAGLTESDVLVKLIMDGHIDETELPSGRT